MHNFTRLLIYKSCAIKIVIMGKSKEKSKPIVVIFSILLPSVLVQ